jgi:hypothetical protein
VIQFRIEVVEMKGGRIAVEAKIAVCKNTATDLERKVTEKLSVIVTEIMERLAKDLPESAIAKTIEDVETMKGLEDLDLNKEDDSA